MMSLSINPSNLQRIRFSLLQILPSNEPIKQCRISFRTKTLLRHQSLIHYVFRSPKITCSYTSEKSPNIEARIVLLKTYAKRLAILIVGSLLFLSRFNSKPAMASTETQETSIPDSKTDNIGDAEEDLYLKILEGNPKDVEALKVILYGKMRKGKTKEAVKYVEKLIAVEPEEIEWRLLQALSYELMGQLSKAKILFKEILKKKPLSLRALHGLALVMHKNHEGAAVFVMLNHALELAKQEKRITEERNIRILIAQMHVVKGELEEGLQKFKVLADQDPRDFRPYLCQGIIYSLLDKTKEADEQFEIYRTLVPHEFPQRSFLDEAILAAKTESSQHLAKGI